MFLQTLLRPKFILYNYSNLYEHDENLAEVLLKKHQRINFFYCENMCRKDETFHVEVYIFYWDFFFKNDRSRSESDTHCQYEHIVNEETESRKVSVIIFSKKCEKIK